MSLDALVIQQELEQYRLPEHVINRVLATVGDGEHWRREAQRLENRVAYLEQHVPPEIKNPPPAPEPYRPHRRNE